MYIFVIIGSLKKVRNFVTEYLCIVYCKVDILSNIELLNCCHIISVCDELLQNTSRENY